MFRDLFVDGEGKECDGDLNVLHRYDLDCN